MTDEHKDLLDEIKQLIETKDADRDEKVKALEGKIAAMQEASENDAALAEIKSRFDEMLAVPPESKRRAEAPEVISSEHLKYDNYSVPELSMTAEFLKRSGAKVDEGLHQSLAARLQGEDGKENPHAAIACKSFLNEKSVKANEISQSTLSGSGDEWVGVGYSSTIWQKIRNPANIVGKIPAFDFPAGVESFFDPLESTDPTWYLVAQAASLSSNPGGIPTNTVTASNLGTARKQHVLSKLGCRAFYTGELTEDAVLPFANQLMIQIATSGSEMLESAVIDGDTDTSGTTNINDIGGTPAGSEYFLAFDGMRKLALVTNTANSRSGGSLTTDDYLETVKLMGVGGRNAQDRNAVEFIIPTEVNFKSLPLADLKTRDVNAQATVENGNLSYVYGYNVNVSSFMHKPGSVNAAPYSYLANSAGKIDVDTASNNTTGSILAVRFDQWKMGMRRRMTMETTRIPAADTTEIVAMLRASLTYRDNEAAAITYNITL